ncbi:uncharacterized protein A1O5_00148 [Cladophialophora psammophila CBS 110553]|uniref:Xylanolytic transcriptional activator regulatory domain-containing protein n=1 Tax=Cladophialophora psammophila CBS 110553 TaxID=1182543 RepID=W9XFA7_9EURO|nr:uncharacterized protein A1O5_00148 [Cladophialophora psammophila CBS 110553]EXJ75641.1 hypothetical protein A1O5_00148 [Cladophialophora psammophila CBS 110553]
MPVFVVRSHRSGIDGVRLIRSLEETPPKQSLRTLPEKKNTSTTQVLDLTRFILTAASSATSITRRATCLGFDSIHGIDKPRSIVRDLEDQVGRLSVDLAAVKSQTCSIWDTVGGTVERLTTRLAIVTVEPTGRPRKQEQLLPLVSSYFLSDSPLPYLNRQARDATKGAEPQVQSWRAMAISSIPRHVVDAMLKHYCETYRPQYPSIGEEDLYRARDKVYESSQLVGYDAFVIYITLAISSNTLMHIDEKRAATTTDGLWATAVVHLEQVGATSSWERLQALQLLTHYGFLNPQHVNVSHCAAAASRLALHLGLHEELPISTQVKLEPAILNTRRRMFWNAYGIDAAAHSVRCQPFKWSRPAITAKFPDSESQAIPTHSAHMWSLREIECEITLGLYYPVFAHQASNADTSFESWYISIQARLEDWYQAIRQSINLTEKIEFHELLFQIQVLRLNRPSPRCPTPTKEMRKRAVKASIALIKEYTVLDRLGKMFMLWHAAHCVVEAGVYLLSSVLTGIESKSQDRRHLGGEDVNILARYVKTFPSLIWKISRRWPSVMPYASAMDAISVSVLENLHQWSDGQDSWSSDFVSLKQRLDQLTLFSPTPSKEQAPRSYSPQTGEIDQYQGLPTFSHLPGQSYTISESSSFQLSTNRELSSINSGWLGSQPGPEQSVPFVPESYTLEYGDPMAWDFSGIDSEEIFAALLEQGQSDILMLQ